MPLTEMLMAGRRACRNTDRSVSIPVSNSNRNIPSWATASSMAFWAGAPGNSWWCSSGTSAPSTEGPSSTPAMICPMTGGWPMRCISSPAMRPVMSSTTI